MRGMLARGFILLALVSLAACATKPAINTDTLRADVGYLASDALEGRMTGSAGEKLAAHYIEQRLREAQLEPAFGDSYRQPFDFNAGSTAIPGSSIRVGETEADIGPLGFSKNGIAEGRLCYVGYGVVGAGRDDYEGLDVEGAVVVVDRHAPQDIEPEERRELAPFLAARHRAWLAERRGAVGILFVSDSSAHRPPGAVARGKQIALAAAAIDRGELERIAGPTNDLAPRAEHPHASPSCEGPAARIETKLAREKGHGQNVAGLLRANAEGPAEYTIVVGAHYDHLGLGEIGSLQEGATGVVHNGADDNASGTAAVIALAEFAGGFERRDHDIVFVGFSGEEIGLIGSSEFATQWSEDTSRPPMGAMINFDMIGRLDDTLIIQGAGSSLEWPEMVTKAKRSARTKVDVRMTESAYLPTDAMSFYLLKLPVLNFFSGAHAEYHKPGDDTELINYEGMSTTIGLAGVLLERLSTSALPIYQPAATPERRTGPGMLSVYLGTIPDYSGKESEGLALAGVRDSGPAARGGLRAGDVILRIDDTEITDVYTYTYFLSGIAPDTEIVVLIKRDGKQLTLRVVPEGR
jgi:aminopeptidase YwaD